MSDILQNAFEFSESDLDANRQGQLTEWQQRRLHEKRSSAWPSLAAGAVLIIIGLLRLSNTTVALIVLAAGAYFLYDGYSRWRNFERESRASEGAQSVKGWASKQKTTRRNGSNYTLSINGESFSLTRFQYETLVEGKEYCIYYTPLTRTILSAQAIVSEPRRPIGDLTA